VTKRYALTVWGVVALGRGALAQREHVTRLGAAHAYGPGIVGVSSQQVVFHLTRAAHVIVLRVDAAGDIEPIFPVWSDQLTEYPAGAHSIEGPPLDTATQPSKMIDPVLRSPAAVARAGRRAPPPGADLEPRDVAPAATWLLIVSDVPTSASELRARLEALHHGYVSVRREVEALPRDLLAQRTRVWAAYYAAVPQ
jgi:hypothetical protein